VHKDCLTRSRRDPQDSKKFHMICDVCNKCFIDKQLLSPYMKNVKKVKGMVNQRQTDVSVLDVILKEVSGQVSNTQVKDYDKMTLEEQTEYRLNREVADFRENIKALDKRVDTLRDEEEEVNLNLMRAEQFHSDKVKLVNEM